MSNDKVRFGFGFKGWDNTKLRAPELREEPPDACAGTISGQHCWADTGVRLLTNPPMQVEGCKHCSMTRHLVAVKKLYSYTKPPL